MRIASMVDLSCEASFVVTEQAMTGRETPHARPSAILLKNCEIKGSQTNRAMREAEKSKRRLELDFSIDVPWHKHVGNIFILAQKRQMQKNLDGLRVSCHDDQLRNAAVECLGSLVRALLDLLVVGCLLYQILQGDGEFGIGEWKGFFGHFVLEGDLIWNGWSRSGIVWRNDGLWSRCNADRRLTVTILLMARTIVRESSDDGQTQSLG